MARASSGTASAFPPLVVGLILLVLCGPVRAQSVDVSPFLGYRFGGDLYEEITGTSLDIDGALCAGVLLDAYIDRRAALTVIYSHQEALLDVPRGDRPPRRVRLSIDHWHVGGKHEFDSGTVRPYVLATLGLTRYGSSVDSEMRFSLGAGGGVKVMPAEHFGVRFDGRTYAVFVDGRATTGVCSPGACVIGLDASVVWQVEFTTGLVVSF